MNRQGGNHRPNGHETHNGHDRRDAHGEGHDHEGQGHHEGHEAIALVVSRRRRARSLSVRARAFVARARGVRQAVRRAAVHPERVARAGKNGVVDERNFMQRIVEAGALAGAGMAGRQLATRAFKP